MRSLFFSIGLIGLLTCSTGAQSTELGANEALQKQIRDVENGLPLIVKDGRTLEYSLREWMDALGVPGLSIAVIEDYQVVWAKGYGGIAAGATGVPVTAETIFQAASISKPITALAILHFTEQGAFDLDLDVNEYLQSWKLPTADLSSTEQVTLRHLLANAAGITPGGFTGYQRDALLPNITQILDGQPPATNRAARIMSVPGAAVSNSGLGYTMVELALVEHLGKPFEEIVKASVFRPVGMRNSTFEQVLPDALAARAAHGHRSTGEAVALGWYAYPELAAAGLWSTSSDLALLAIEVAKSKSGKSNRILGSKMTRQMLAQHKDEMGLGFLIRPGDAHGYFAHSGGNQGYQCHLEMLADTGQGVVIMTNSDAGLLLISLLVRSVAQEYKWPSHQNRPVSTALADAIFAQHDRAKTRRMRLEVDDTILAQYVGRYELAQGLDFEISLASGYLKVRLGDQPRFPIYPKSETKFFYEVVDAQITFVRNTAGQVVSLLLHQGGQDQEARKID